MCLVLVLCWGGGQAADASKVGVRPLPVAQRCLQESGLGLSQEDFSTLVPLCSRALAGTSFLLFDYSKFLGLLNKSEGTCRTSMTSHTCTAPAPDQ